MKILYCFQHFLFLESMLAARGVDFHFGRWGRDKLILTHPLRTTFTPLIPFQSTNKRDMPGFGWTLVLK